MRYFWPMFASKSPEISLINVMTNKLRNNDDAYMLHHKHSQSADRFDTVAQLSSMDSEMKNLAE